MDVQQAGRDTLAMIVRNPAGISFSWHYFVGILYNEQVISDCFIEDFVFCSLAFFDCHLEP